MDFTADSLIERVRLWGSVPDSNNTYTDEIIVDFINDELFHSTVPLITGIRELYFTEFTDYVIDVNQEKYAIPSNAVGMSVKDVVTVDSDGNEVSLPQYSLFDKNKYRRGYQSLAPQSGFTIIKNSIQLRDPQAHVGKSLRIYYDRRIEQITQNKNGGKILGVTLIDFGPNAGDYSIAISNLPDAWVSTEDNYTLSTGSLPFEVENRSVPLTITGTSFVYPDPSPGTLPEGIRTGNWITQDGFTVIPSLPLEAIDYTCQSSIVKILEAMGDMEENQGAVERLKQMEQRIKRVMSPRIDGESVPYKGARELWGGV